jgi:lipid-A-disaccharide synthase
VRRATRLLLSCGEPSGDLYAGALTRELRALDPGATVAGLGGPAFAAAGGQLLADYRGLSVTGLTEAVAKLPRSWATMRQLRAAAAAAPPDALVVVDFPDFNLRLARAIKRLGVPVVYYVSPQIWAWRPGRLKTIRAVADLVLVIFPFEEAIYRNAGVPPGFVEFVGHPLVDAATATVPRAEFLRGLGLDPAAQTVAILPGSRPNEVREILPTLLEAARQITARLPGTQFLIARAPNLDDELFAGDGVGVRPGVRRGVRVGVGPVVVGQTDNALAAADLTLIASGTATVQAALHGTPMVIVYRLSPLTYRLGRPLVIVDTYGMPNLIAGERIVPELIQDGFSAEAVASEAVSLLTDSARAESMRAALFRVRERLGVPGASRRAAEAILRVARR